MLAFLNFFDNIFGNRMVDLQNHQGFPFAFLSSNLHITDINIIFTQNSADPSDDPRPVIITAYQHVTGGNHFNTVVSDLHNTDIVPLKKGPGNGITGLAGKNFN